MTAERVEPATSTHVEVRRGVYYDSVTLMRVSRQLSGRAEVSHALTAMATELNRELLVQMGFEPPADAGPTDLLVAIRTVDQAVLADAREALDALLTDASRAPVSEPGPGDLPASRTIGSAAGRADATLALVSVPGQYAFIEAMDALSSGLSVMIFSDNVPVEEEIALKEEAARRDLLVMGPDCGTAVVGGAGLGFANAVRPGPVGLVAASGTGAQQLMSLLDTAGVGISHALGVGGRDLSAKVSGRSTLQALAALDADPATELIVIVSKPPAPRVAGLIREAVRRLSTPVVFAPLGPDEDDLTTVTERALGRLGREVPGWPHWPAPVAQTPGPGFLRGLFVGGTLCEEAMLIAADAVGPVWSNTVRSNTVRSNTVRSNTVRPNTVRPNTVRPDTVRSNTLRSSTMSSDTVGSDLPLTETGEPAWSHGETSRGHSMIDFGADELTRGRAHPMIDPTLRLERIAAEAADPSCAVLLLDVVLGYGAELDPAALLAPAIEDALAARGGDLAVVVSLCGTAADPQDRDGQAAALRDAGAAVFCSNAMAARHAVSLVQDHRPDQ